MKLAIEKVKSPKADNSKEVVMLTEETIHERKNKLLEIMKKKGFSSLVIYADKEHGGNFEYLTGFIPRFEEGLQIFNIDGSSTLILGNENFNKVKFSRIPSEGKKCSLFSLPNQPMNNLSELENILEEVKIDSTDKVGVVGWKMIPEMTRNFDVPSFIIDVLKTKISEEKLYNATGLFIDPSFGVRTINNANEIAHYEYGASLASDGVLEAMNALEIGRSELEVGDKLTKDGQFPNVITISAFGDRFQLANIYPTHKTLSLGDKVALTVSYRGGLSSRSGYAVTNREELERVDKGYLENVVLPYLSAYYFWLENIKIGTEGGRFFEAFSHVYPQETYGWELCPGHLTSNEEWLSSPFYKGSKAKIKSGMIFQVDFIPIQKGHNGVSAESTVAIADHSLQRQLQKEYPQLWKRIEARKNYMVEVLNINLPEEVLPLCSTVGYYRPYLLNKDYAVVKK